MNGRGKKFLALFLVFSLAAFSGNLTAQVKKGVKVSVETNDDQTISGELISVKRDSLLLLDSETQEDLSINIDVVKIITVDNKSRMFELGLLGILLGVAVQGLKGTELEEETTHWEGSPVTQSKSKYFEYGAIGGGAGVLLGTVIGMNKKIQIQGKSEAEIVQALEKLSNKARVKGLQ